MTLTPEGHNNAKQVKPPLGLKPRRITYIRRVRDIDDAMKRYAASRWPIPDEWLEERDELMWLLME